MYQGLFNKYFCTWEYLIGCQLASRVSLPQDHPSPPTPPSLQFTPSPCHPLLPVPPDVGNEYGPQKQQKGDPLSSVLLQCTTGEEAVHFQYGMKGSGG